MVQNEADRHRAPISRSTSHLGIRMPRASEAPGATTLTDRTDRALDRADGLAWCSSFLRKIHYPLGREFPRRRPALCCWLGRLIQYV